MILHKHTPLMSNSRVCVSVSVLQLSTWCNRWEHRQAASKCHHSCYMYEKDMVCMLSSHEQPHTSSAIDAPVHAVSEPSHINPPGARLKTNQVAGCKPVLWKASGGREWKNPTVYAANVLASVPLQIGWTLTSLSWSTWCHWTPNEDSCTSNQSWDSHWSWAITNVALITELAHWRYDAVCTLTLLDDGTRNNAILDDATWRAPHGRVVAIG